ncbi:MAG: hypothetical protein GY934_20215, partial [Gammaproteobacteria bacterium]|nr:hypothetical protein [Gammaproteobacteria bacterium]
SGNYQGTGGGGGRIALYYGDATGFDLEAQILARGGAGYSSYLPWGGAGTIYLKQATAPTGQLRVDNGAAPVGNVAITGLSGFQSEPLNMVNAYLSLDQGSPLSEASGDGASTVEVTGNLNTPSLVLSNITLTSSAAVDQNSPALVITTDQLTIEPDASIDVSAKGILKTAEVTGNSGGSYGG